MLMLAVCAMAQNSVTLNFTCRTTDGYWIKPDSITVENLSSGWTETLIYPDTLYVLNVWTGIENVETCHGASLQTTPNPFNGTTTVNLQMPETGDVQVLISDINGRTIVEAPYYDASTTYYDASTGTMTAGTHRMRVSLRTPGIYMLTARVNGKTLSAKLVNTGNGGKDAVEFNGIVEAPYYDASTTPKSAKGSSTHPFQLGDRMRYVAYVGNTASEAVTQFQSQSEDITLVFSISQPVPGDAVPCPGTPTVTDYDGNVYNTVQIGQQCWMKENLRTRHYANGDSIPAAVGSYTSTPCYYNDATSSIPLAQRGYYYNWSAVMHGASGSSANPSDVQGICPQGWHVPSDAEWTQLANYVGSHSQYVCDGDSTHIAKALASPTYWDSSSNSCTPGNDPSTNNLTGFSVVPMGLTNEPDFFYHVGSRAYFWSSTEYSLANHAWHYSMGYNTEGMGRGFVGESSGFSVRCVLGAGHSNNPNDGQPCTGAVTVSDYDNNTYNTVQIGAQCWMKENLRTTHYANGQNLANGGSSYSHTNPYYYNYTTSSIPLAERGLLYNWPAVIYGSNSSSANPSGVQGICPNGWHVPSNAEWMQLANYVGGQSQYVCGNDSTHVAQALASPMYWYNTTNSCAPGYPSTTNNVTGFSAIPVGTWPQAFCCSGSVIQFWSSTSMDVNNAWFSEFLSDNANMISPDTPHTTYDNLGAQKYVGFSVRCVKN